MEYFEASDLPPLRYPAKLRIHGGFGRNDFYPKKSFRVTYRTGGKRSRQILNTVAPSGTNTEKTLVLRKGGDHRKVGLRDMLFQSLYAEIGGLGSAFQPCVLFINGRTWGIYNIRERINVDYLHTHIGPGQYDLIADGSRAVSGRNADWIRTQQYFQTADLSKEAEFQKASKLVDIDNFTDYWLMNIILANADWPSSNMYKFRSRDKVAARWKWVSWDADMAFNHQGKGLRHNTLAWAIRDRVRNDLISPYRNWGWKDQESKVKATLVVRGLLKNERYRKYFIDRFCDILNLYLTPQKIETKLDEILGMVKHDLPLNWQRWNLSPKEYWKMVARIRDFAHKRPEIVRNDLRKGIRSRSNCYPPAIQ